MLSMHEVVESGDIEKAAKMFQEIARLSIGFSIINIPNHLFWNRMSLGFWLKMVKVATGTQLQTELAGLRIIRLYTEDFGEHHLSSSRCAGVGGVALMDRYIKDRPMHECLERTEKALKYCQELDCLPIDELVLKEAVGIYKNDIGLLEEVLSAYKKWDGRCK